MPLNCRNVLFDVKPYDIWLYLIVWNKTNTSTSEELFQKQSKGISYKTRTDHIFLPAFGTNRDFWGLYLSKDLLVQTYPKLNIQIQIVLSFLASPPEGTFLTYQ